MGEEELDHGPQLLRGNETSLGLSRNGFIHQRLVEPKERAALLFQPPLLLDNAQGIVSNLSGFRLGLLRGESGATSEFEELFGDGHVTQHFLAVTHGVAENAETLEAAEEDTFLDRAGG